MTDFKAHDAIFHRLLDFFVRVPPMFHNDTPSRGFGTGIDNGMWWVKFSLDINHPLAWNAVQEFGHVLNYLSLDERLPTVFRPVSPPPYLNGGPKDFLSWTIECLMEDMKPDVVTEWLEGRLPRPVDDLAQWTMDEE